MSGRPTSIYPRTISLTLSQYSAQKMPIQPRKPGIALVTGSSSGIGRASALALASDGWTVVVTARRQAELDETVKLMKDPKKGLAIAADLSKSEDVVRVFATIKEKFGTSLRACALTGQGRLDMLFNVRLSALTAGANAEILERRDVFSQGASGRSTAPALYGRHDCQCHCVVPVRSGGFQNHEKSIPARRPVSCIRTTMTPNFPCFEQRHSTATAKQSLMSRIINNGSISAYTPRPNSAPYTMSKHAILGLTKCLSLDGRKHNIACSQIDIGRRVFASQLTTQATP